MLHTQNIVLNKNIDYILFDSTLGILNMLHTIYVGSWKINLILIYNLHT